MGVLYVYAVTREPAIPGTEGIDGTTQFGTVSSDDVSATFTTSDLSQDVIDQRANDVEWLGAIGYRHQSVVNELMKQTAVVPLRAFTLFSSPDALRGWLANERDLLVKTLDRLDGKREWTLRVEFEPSRWSEAINRRVPALIDLQKEIETAAPGKAFLLTRKLGEERKKHAQEAERLVVGEIESLIVGRLQCEALAETRERRDGAFPQINILITRDEESSLQELIGEVNQRFGEDGVSVGVTGPWPPYSFVS
jgi:hypothetical protein